MPTAETYDYIIVGAGSAGCVVANRLSADPDCSVLLVEAGGRDRNPLFRLPMLMGRLFHSGICNWSYHTEPVPALEGRSLYWPRGKVLGGSSTINGMVYVRGNRHDYDRWAQMGLPGWSYDEVLPAFRRSEAHVERDDVYHHRAGELTVCRARGRNPLFDRFVEAGGQAGHPVNDDFNGAEQEGCGRYDFTIRRGKRWSTSFAFLRPVRHRRNLTVLTDALTRRVLVENGRASGVEVARNGQARRVGAAREVILSAGTVNSPQLLLLSVIGPPGELERHGIEVVHDLPGVGRNLQDHVDCVLSWECREPITLYRDLRADRLAASIVRGMVFGEGIATTFPYKAGAFLRTRPELVAPDIQLHFMPALERTANLHFPNPFKRDPVEANHGLTVRVGPIVPESRGTVTLRSADPAAPPRIQPPAGSQSALGSSSPPRRTRSTSCPAPSSRAASVPPISPDAPVIATRIPHLLAPSIVGSRECTRKVVPGGAEWGGQAEVSRRMAAMRRAVSVKCWTSSARSGRSSTLCSR